MCCNYRAGEEDKHRPSYFYFDLLVCYSTLHQFQPHSGHDRVQDVDSNNLFHYQCLEPINRTIMYYIIAKNTSAPPGLYYSQMLTEQQT